MRRLALATALLALAPAAQAGAACRGAASKPLVSAAAVRTTVCLVNAERRAQGLRPLRTNGRLARAARRYAAQMVADRHFSHVGTDGSTLTSRLRRIGYVPRSGSFSIGENLAWGSGAEATPRAIVRAWMSSPGHREIILTRRFDEVGIGIARGTPSAGQAGWTYAAEFGWRS